MKILPVYVPTSRKSFVSLPRQLNVLQQGLKKSKLAVIQLFCKICSALLKNCNTKLIEDCI